jgi:5-formyltetrahydrofolate cyclo-ligase
LAERQAADTAILVHIRALPAYRSARRVSLFITFEAEPDLSPLIRFAQRKQFFSPVLIKGQMH